MILMLRNLKGLKMGSEQGEALVLYNRANSGSRVKAIG